MGVNFLGKILGVNTSAVNSGAVVGASRGIDKSFISKPYAQVKTPNAPKLTDSVPTKHADGTPFWSDYVTPNNVWVA